MPRPHASGTEGNASTLTRMPGLSQPEPPNLRRRILVALGFGAATAAIGRSLPEDGEDVIEAEPAATTTPPSDNSAAESATPSTTEPPVVLTEPPALADAGPEVDLATHVFDVVIRGGRVIDPMSGFDGVLAVGLNGGVITAITAGEPLPAEVEIDATGRVVSPGFVDLLSYEPNPVGVWTKAADGVTTNLAMHGVNNYAPAFFERYSGSSPIHFGGAFHQHFMRGQDLGARPDVVLDEPQVAAFATLARQSLGAGFAGVAFSPEYSPATSAVEIEALATVAGEFGHVAFFHTRSSDPATSLSGVIEALDLGRRTGIGVHISHFHSTGATNHMVDTIAAIEAARADGVDATACVYPYDFWATTLQSFRFVGDWQGRYGLTYEDLQIAGTGTTLTADTYNAAFSDNRLVAALSSIDQAEIDLALAQPWVMLGSDAILEADQNNHPRASGTFSRLLGRYVRDRGVLSLPEGLAKMTSLPTQRVEAMIPAMKRKGRLQRGADADITIFDPATIIDRATIDAPGTPAWGIEQVFVGGRRVIADGEARRTVFPGQPLTSN